MCELDSLSSMVRDCLRFKLFSIVYVNQLSVSVNQLSVSVFRLEILKRYILYTSRRFLTEI